MNKKTFKEVCAIYSELLFRIDQVQEAAQLFYYFGQGLDEKRRMTEKEWGKENLREDRLRYILTNYAILQITSVLDCRGEFSLCIRKSKNYYKLNPKRLKKIFPALKEETVSKIVGDINASLNKNRQIFELIEKTRNKQIAHASKITHKVLIEVINGDEYPYSVRKKAMPSGLSYKRLWGFASELRSALSPISYGLEEFGASRGWI